nr:odorant receptor 2 [Graphosoma rubrolineatum]
MLKIFIRYESIFFYTSPKMGTSPPKMHVLRSDRDIEIDEEIDRMYHKLTTISAVHPVFDKKRPLLCVMNLLIFILHSLSLNVMNICLVLTAIELYNINLVPFFHGMHITFMGFLSNASLWHSWLKRSTVSRLHRLILQDFFDYNEELEDKKKKLWDEMMKEKKWHIFYIITIGVAVSIVLILIPNVNHQFGTFQYNSTVHNVNFDLPVPLGYPFLGNEPLKLLTGSLLSFLSGFSFTLTNCAKSLMIINCNLHLQMQLKFLLYQIENIEYRAGRLHMQLYGVQPKNTGLKLYDAEFMKCYDICLRRSVQHHQIIVRAAEEFNEVFSFFVFFFYLTGAADIAMVLLSTSATEEFPGNTIGAVVMCAVEVGFVFLFAHMGQRITDLSVELREVIYNMPWYRCDQGIKRTMRILQIATLKPLSFSYYDLLHINYDSFATVINSAYSYYNLVNALRD